MKPWYVYMLLCNQKILYTGITDNLKYRLIEPKGTDFRTISEEDIKTVEHALNTRPRKRHNWKTPLEVFNQSVALEG
jgi:IS30 family transposase